jgi:hypothetical protein
MKTSVVITSYRIFAFLEDIGGILGAIQMVLPFIGSYLSSQLFKADFIKTFFKQKMNTGSQMKLDFKKILIPIHMTILEPIFLPLIHLFCWCKVCKRNCYHKKY